MITPFLLYIGRASLYLAIFYAFYLLVMRRTSFFRLNRIVLLLGTVVCHLLPLLRLRTVFVSGAGDATVQAGEPVMVGVGAQGAAIAWPVGLYLAGVAAVAALVLLSVLRTLRLIRDGETSECEGYSLTLVDRDVPSFSWCRHIVMSREDYESFPAILRHELQHIHAHHSLDVLLMTAVNAIHWFNPLAWIARAELRLLHEYEADEGLIRQGIDATSYQLLLVRKAVGEQRFSLANGFNHAKLKQRIAMMHKKPTSGWMRLAYVALLPLLAGTMFLCNPARAEIRPASSETATVAEMPAIAEAPVVAEIPTVQNPPADAKTFDFSSIEDKPTFQGGDAQTFGKWVSTQLNYPEDEKNAGHEGRVMLQFAINTDGSVSDVKVMRSCGYEALDAEAVRVISSSPNWKPGMVNGEPVKVTFMFPVIYQVRGEKETPVIISASANGSQPGIKIWSTTGETPLIYLDGVKYTGNINDIDPATISSMEVLKGQNAIDKYGEEAKNGVLLITSKKQ